MIAFECFKKLVYHTGNPMHRTSMSVCNLVIFKGNKTIGLSHSHCQKRYFLCLMLPLPFKEQCFKSLSKVIFEQHTKVAFSLTARRNCAFTVFSSQVFKGRYGQGLSQPCHLVTLFSTIFDSHHSILCLVRRK